MQKVTIPKRLMTLFLVFVMVLGLLPVSNLVVPANAADARSGPDDVVTINRGETEFFDDYTSPVLGKVIPRNLVFEANGQLTGGFCGDHSKEYSPHVKYINPTPISETKYAVADGLFCREIDGLFCRSSPDIIVRRRCVLSHKRRGWLQPSPSFRYSRNLALQDELYHPVINNGPAVLVCVDKRLGTGPVNQSRDAG